MSDSPAHSPEIVTALDEYTVVVTDSEPLSMGHAEYVERCVIARAALTAAIARSLAAATERTERDAEDATKWRLFGARSTHAERDADDRNAAIREKIAPAFNALWRDVVGIEEAHHWADHVENIDQVDRAISAALGTPTFYEQFREQLRAARSTPAPGSPARADGQFQPARHLGEVDGDAAKHRLFRWARLGATLRSGEGAAIIGHYESAIRAAMATGDPGSLDAALRFGKD